MPNRILRDYTDSRKFEGLSPLAERLFIRLIMKADDFGRFHSDHRLIRSAAFPLDESVRATDVGVWLDELEAHRLVVRYENKGKAVVAIVNNRQRIKPDCKPRFPAPTGKPDTWLPDDDNLPPPSGNFPDDPGTSGLGGGVGVFEGGGVFGRHRAPPPPEFEPIGKGVYRKELVAMVSDAQAERKKTAEQPWARAPRLIKAVQDIVELWSSEKRDGWEKRVADIKARADSWEPGGWSEAGKAHDDAWVARIAEIKAAMNGVKR